MKLSGLLLQASLIVLLAFGTPSKANGKALKQWLDCAKEWNVFEGVSYWDFDVNDVTSTIKQLTQIHDITFERNEEHNHLDIVKSNIVLTENSERQLKSSGNFLPYLVDKATFLRVNHVMWGIFFGTAALSGCDVWIADHKDYDPLIVHINANSIKPPADNLQHKEDLAKEALDYFNENVMVEESKYFKFIQRISYDYAQSNPSDKDDITDYWNRYVEENKQIPYELYYAAPDHADSVFFYGLYDACYFTEVWNFVLKEITNGKILLRVSCSTKWTYCTIQ